MSEQQGERRRSGTVEHVVRTTDGGYKRLLLPRMLAMVAMCAESLGFEEGPNQCTSICCPLFLYRAKTHATRRGNITKADFGRQKAKNERGE